MASDYHFKLWLFLTIKHIDIISNNFWLFYAYYLLILTSLNRSPPLSSVGTSPSTTNQGSELKVKT